MIRPRFETVDLCSRGDAVTQNNAVVPQGAVRRTAKRTIGSARRLSVHRSNRQVGAAIVYHAVTACPSRREELSPATPVDVLEVQVAHLARHYDVVPASVLPERVARRAPGERCPVAITFDDDHASYVPLALPVLAEHGLTATFFLNGASIDRPYWFPWERLEAAWETGLFEVCTAEMPDSVLEAAASADRPLEAVSRALTAIPREERLRLEKVLDDVVDDALMPPRMRRSDVRRLVDEGHEIGFHTRWHEHLTELCDAELREAMSEGRADLEELVGSPLTVLAYPFGDWDVRVARAAEEAGFTAAYAVESAAFDADRPWSSLPRLPRPLVTGDVFSFVVASALAGS
jgi:peptidoglycan/xylan/chitin deacetylase (PgdA/CDA1 family)